MTSKNDNGQQDRKPPPDKPKGKPRKAWGRALVPVYLGGEHYQPARSDKYGPIEADRVPTDEVTLRDLCRQGLLISEEDWRKEQRKQQEQKQTADAVRAEATPAGGDE